MGCSAELFKDGIYGKMEIAEIDVHLGSSAACSVGNTSLILKAYSDGKLALAPIFIIMGLLLALTGPKLRKL